MSQIRRRNITTFLSLNAFSIVAGLPGCAKQLERASFLLRRIHEGDHKALRNALDAAAAADALIAKVTANPAALDEIIRTA